jgi:hypothetical protein
MLARMGQRVQGNDGPTRVENSPQPTSKNPTFRRLPGKSGHFYTLEWVGMSLKPPAA